MTFLTLHDLGQRLGLSRSQLLRVLRSYELRADGRRGHALVWRADRLAEIRAAAAGLRLHKDLLGPLAG